MRRTSRLFALVAGLLVGGSVGAQELADLNKPITIDLPGLLPFGTSLQPVGDWPLTIRLLANKPIGIYSGRMGRLPPYAGEHAWLVWADPDGVFTGNCNPGAAAGSGCAVPTVNDTYLEFTLGHSAQGSTGAPLTVSCYHFPGVPYVYAGNIDQCPVGPPAGGYGRSSAVPGLVILSSTGVGREFTLDTSKAIAWTGRARNLAGFVDSVGWTVNDRMPFIARTGVVAQLDVPFGLFDPLLFEDAEICTDAAGNLVPCPFKWSLEGTSLVGDTATALAAWRATVTTLRIFVLDGPAPDLLDDLNHDGVVDARDALLATNPITQRPYRLLSGERVVRFQTDLETTPTHHPIAFDFDGDGMEPITWQEPAGAGGVVKIPR
jgi:hypothetical protein